MLNLIRNNIQSFGVKFVVGIVVLVMSFFGISAYQSQSSNTIVTVDGYEVKLEKFQRAFENAREEVRRRYGNQASDYLKMVNLESQVIQQLTSSALLLKSAELNGLAVSDMELANAIYTNPTFITDNRFDPNKYADGLANLGLDKLDYEREMKEELLARKFYQFVSTGALFSRKSLEDEYRRYEAAMTIKAIEFDPVLFANEAVVTDQELESFYELHKSDFQQKNQFNLKYFILGINDVSDKVTVRDKEITNYYENNVNTEFTLKASFHSRHILIATPQDGNEEAMAKAKQRTDSIYQQLLADRKKFPELAKTYSDDPGSARNGGDLGWVEKGSFVSEFESVIENLQPNELSKPFLSNFGYHIVEVLDKKEAAARPFESVKAEIEQKIRANKAKRRLTSQVAKLLETATEKSIEDLAQSVNKTVAQTGDFDDTKELNGIGNSRSLYQELTGKTASTKGKYILDGEEQILVYEITATKDPYIKPLDEVKEQVRFYAKEEKKTNLANERLTVYASTTKTMADLEALAKKLNTNVISLTFKFSDRQIGDLRTGSRFRTDVYKLEKDQVGAVRDMGRGYLVYLVDKKPGELNDKSLETLTALEGMMQSQKSQVVLNGLINKLQKEIKVDYNQPLLKALNVNFES